MRDKAYRLHKRRVEALIKKWVHPLGFGWQRLTFRWHDAAIEGHEGALMVCTPQWEYHGALIRVDVTVVEDTDDDELELAFIHELMHVVLAGMWEMRNCEDDNARRLVEEHTATWLAKIIRWAYQTGEKNALKRAAKKQAA